MNNSISLFGFAVLRYYVISDISIILSD